MAKSPSTELLLDAAKKSATTKRFPCPACGEEISELTRASHFFVCEPKFENDDIDSEE